MLAADGDQKRVVRRVELLIDIGDKQPRTLAQDST